MPSVGRKFLLAGKGGLNLTHSEPFDAFVVALRRRAARRSSRCCDAFDAQALRDWAHGLGIETFVGTSGRVFPTDMKAAPLLRAWLHRLRGAGVQFHMRHRWLGWTDATATLRFADAAGRAAVRADAVVLALGGASWPRLGSDGAWVPLLRERGVDGAPAAAGQLRLRRAAAGASTSPTRFAGQPFKSVAIRFAAVPRARASSWSPRPASKAA